ncbi:MAG: hypothetical protein JJU27_19530 [Gammaproteobacteria bacterium]|nr:hypothetical protein [Gammaproteobacteria bacterium]
MKSAALQERCTDSLGYRAKIGVLVPATNTIAQPEYEAMRVPGVTNHVARMEPSRRGQAGGDMAAYRRSLERGSEHISVAIAQLLPCRPDLILLGHSIDTFRGGVAGAKELHGKLVDHAEGIPVILPSHAFLAALRVLGVGARVGVLTPYWPPGDEQVREFFEDADYEVVRIIGLKCPDPLAIAGTPQSRVVSALKELAAEDVDVILQPGTNLATARLAASAETWLGKPIVACNTATYWHALRTLGISSTSEGFGPLLANH